MRYAWLCAAALSLCAGSALAQGATGQHDWQAPKTRQEAIARVKDHLARLENMSDQQWQDMQKRRAERRAEWKSMTPEQRAAARQRWQQNHEGTSSAAPMPAAAPSAAPSAAR